MNRLLASISLLAALASQASAQCFESSFGTLLGVGDDTLLALQPMNFVFPMPAGGVAASYTHAQANTNGNIYLTNGLASGGTATGYSSSAAGKHVCAVDQTEVAVGLRVVPESALGERVVLLGQEAGRSRRFEHLLEELLGVATPVGAEVGLDQPRRANVEAALDPG